MSDGDQRGADIGAWEEIAARATREARGLSRLIAELEGLRERMRQLSVVAEGAVDRLEAGR